MTGFEEAVMLTIADLAARLAVSEPTVKRWRKDGTLPRHLEVPCGRTVRFHPGLVEDWLQSGKGMGGRAARPRL